jgi:hypothetical protein
MKKGSHFVIALTMIVLISVAPACAPVKKELPEGARETACIEGIVWFQTPSDADPLPYPQTQVTAWRHGTKEALAEAKADNNGKYCIEIPVGDDAVDLRVWGLQNLEGTSYVCNGSRDNIALGTSIKRCGEDCMKINIETQCTQDFRKRRQ